ncbi:hypothetical protein BFP70_01875 [Thioclava sp. SK-1]|uniref:MarR family winged helix-turn-helix transcriptional regulator n=1 Tax=Thioclava sp. SK-1 TaxID=1889770 RepID=UPI0008268C02|nr:MarR family winged helix-turn-helix transcriptional regulator [Thioclava sp. SK-1]OCX67362.1 hypothetical protein BFP70_01875 [Thioclava sp. SK-1]
MRQSTLRAGFFRDLVTIARKMRTVFDGRAAEHGLTYARARILLQLTTKDTIGQSELAEAMEVEPPTMARLLEAMEDCGLVTRTIAPKDRRQRNVHLTPAAQDQAAVVLAMTRKLRMELTEGIPPQDLETARDVLAKVLVNASKVA